MAAGTALRPRPLRAEIALLCSYELQDCPLPRCLLSYLHTITSSMPSNTDRKHKMLQ